MSKKPLTLDEFNKVILTKELVTREAVRLMTNSNLFLEIIKFDGPPAPPATRLQLIKLKYYDYRQRIKDAWLILKGGDIHENCGY